MSNKSPHQTIPHPWDRSESACKIELHDERKRNTFLIWLSLSSHHTILPDLPSLPVLDKYDSTQERGVGCWMSLCPILYSKILDINSHQVSQPVKVEVEIHFEIRFTISSDYNNVKAKWVQHQLHKVDECQKLVGTFDKSLITFFPKNTLWFYILFPSFYLR